MASNIYQVPSHLSFELNLFPEKVVIIGLEIIVASLQGAWSSTARGGSETKSPPASAASRVPWLAESSSQVRACSPHQSSSQETALALPRACASSLAGGSTRPCPHDPHAHRRN